MSKVIINHVPTRDVKGKIIKPLTQAQVEKLNKKLNKLSENMRKVDIEPGYAIIDEQTYLRLWVRLANEASLNGKLLQLAGLVLVPYRTHKKLTWLVPVNNSAYARLLDLERQFRSSKKFNKKLKHRLAASRRKIV